LLPRGVALKYRVSHLGIAVALLMAMGGARAHAERMYSITDLGPASFTKLNNRGQAIGTGYTADWSKVGVYYDGATTRELGERFIPRDINDRGQIVGERPDPGDGQRAASIILREVDGTERRLGEPVWDVGSGLALNNRGQVMSANAGGGITTIYSPWGTEELNWRQQNETADSVLGTAFNDAGTVVGELMTHIPNDPITWGFMKEEGGEYYPLHSGPRGVESILKAIAINNVGQVVVMDGNLDSFLFTPGEDGYEKVSWAVALNDLGQVLSMATPEGWWQSYPALYDGGELFMLQDLLPPDAEWNLFRAVDLNDQGQILVTGTSYGSEGYHSLLLTPQAVPEPGTLAIGLVLAGAGVVAHRRRARMRRAAGGS
jgi:hypothetical protein